MDPEDGVSDIAYEKGKSFMRYLEERFGRAAFDRFLIAYFEHFKFQSNTSEGFLEFAKTNLLTITPELLIQQINGYIIQVGLLTKLHMMIRNSQI